MRAVADELAFETIAIVLLPDHLQAIWSLPRNDHDYSARWKRIKDRFTKAWLKLGGSEDQVTASQQRRGHRGIWQRRFWEHTIRDEIDLENHADYIHYNPVKHGLVSRPRDWPYSTFHRFVKAGQYAIDWGRCEPPHLAGLDLE